MRSADVFILYVYIFFTFGSFQVENDGVISMFLLLFWCIANVKYMKTFFSKCVKNKAVCYFLLFLLGFSVMGMVKSDKMLIIKYFFNYIVLFSPYLIYQFYQMDSQRRKLPYIYKGVRVIFWFWVFAAMFYFFQHKGAAAAIASGNWEVEYLAVGGGQFLAYAASIYCVYLLYEYLHIKKKRSNLIAIAVLLLYMIQVESMITILVCGIGCLGAVLFGNRSTKQIIIIIVAAFITGLLIIYYRDIIDWLYIKVINWKVGMTDKLAIRIKHTIMILSGRKTSLDSSFSMRMELYTRSFNTFRQNFLFGTGFQGGEFMRNSLVGAHSEILDAFARWGLPIGCLYLAGFIRPVLKTVQNNGKYILFFTVLIMGAVNPIFLFQVTTTMLLLIPVQSYIIVEEG